MTINSMFDLEDLEEESDEGTLEKKKIKQVALTILANTSDAENRDVMDEEEDENIDEHNHFLTAGPGLWADQA